MTNKHLLIVFLIFNTGCASTPGSNARSQRTGSRSDFDSILIDDPSTKVREKFGDPAEVSEEKYQGIGFRVLEYLDAQGQPRFSFSIDVNSRIVGKTYWLNSKIDELDVSKVLDADFKGVRFMHRTPCRTYGMDETLVNEQQGIFVSTHDNQVVAFSWSSPLLTKLRNAEFILKCPALQNSDGIK